MLSITTYGSSSKGNCYLLSEGSSNLMLEAGINPSKIKVPWGQIDGILVTHEHIDHAKYLDKILKRTGCKVVSSKGTLEAIGVSSHRIVALKSGEATEVGVSAHLWRVMAFGVEHDAKEAVGFVITSPSGKVILFATDTYFIRYRFSKVNVCMIECNYDTLLLQDNYLNRRIDRRQYERIAKSHFSIQNVIKFLRANNSWQGELEEVHLLHLSDRNSNAEQFRRTITRETGVPVYIAGGE